MDPRQRTIDARLVTRERRCLGEREGAAQDRSKGAVVAERRGAAVILGSAVACDRFRLTLEGVPGFGTFEVRTRAARTGRNPRTGETISVAGTGA